MDGVFQKPTLFITLFEKQLLRSYLLSDKGDFFKQLSMYFKLIIVTSSSLEKAIESVIEKYSLETFTSITIFEKYQENIFTRILSSVFRFGNKSTATIQLIQLRKSLGDGFFRTYLRYTIYFLVANLSILKPFLRYMFYCSIRIKTLEKYFNQKIVLDKSSMLFITSLAPLRGEDVPIGLFFKKKKVPIVASVRSWDNLVVNGMLPLLPSTFLCHSEYMFNNAIAKQGIKETSIVMSVTPSYQDKFIPTPQVIKDGRVKFSYMCQGLIMNPDDKNFVEWLVNAWRKMPSYFDLYVVQHPAFIMRDLQINLPSNVKLIVFQFDETSLNDYYSHLGKMDLVFGGGTTGVLDACFLGVPILAIGFEIHPQNYWESALRYLDYFPHSADFFKDSRTTILTTREDLIRKILDYKSIRPLERKIIIKYTGDPTVSMSSVTLNALLKYQISSR
jgi:hypothetical protein